MLKSLYGRIQSLLNKPIKNRHLKTAVPFFLFMAVGLVVIRECATVRYEFRKVKRVNREDLERLGIKLKTPQSLEEAYEEYTRKIDTDNWENVRGPRLWDETPSN